MTNLAEAAAKALADKQRRDAELAEQLRTVMVDRARERAAVLLADPQLAAALQVQHTDLQAFLVVLGDDTVSLAFTDDGDVHLAEQAGGLWTERSGPLADLAELGAALEEA